VSPGDPRARGPGVTSLPVPPHFDAARVADVYRVEYQHLATAAEAWAARYEIAASAADRRRVCLLLVDCQNTFCLPSFELFVGGRSGRGAIDDNVRLCEFIYRNLGVLTEIAPTLDTHVAAQIFHPAFWVNERGEHPVGGQTIITVEDVERGRWRVDTRLAASLASGDARWLAEHALHYVRALAGERYPLMVWPYHAMLGGIGHALVSAVEEAVFFHGVARHARTRFEVKGVNPLTENYSALRPEVLDGPGGETVADGNPAFVDHLLAFDAVIVAGQAKSHCVAWTVTDLLDAIRTRDPALAGRVYLLEDCTSSVVVPGVVDFTDQADEAFQRFAAAGVHVVRSSDPIDHWPGFDG
jgi:nicotinamidase-related amidase